MYGTVNFAVIDTEPGASTAFAPPLGFEGNYREFMKDRCTNDIGAMQHLWVAARRMKNDVVPPEFTGRFAADARLLVRRYGKVFEVQTKEKSK